MWDTVDGASERLRSSTEEEETVWRLTRSSARVPIFPLSWLATILNLTLCPSAARRHSRSSTESNTGRPHNDKLARARPHARPVSFFAMRTLPLLYLLYEVISRFSSLTLIASETTAPASSGTPRCTLKARPRRQDDRCFAVGRAPDCACAMHARVRFHSCGLGFVPPAPP
jgi:hypothetical protein